MVGTILMWVYFGIGILYTFVSGKEVPMGTFKFWLLVNMLFWPIRLFRDLTRGLS
jgi:hypothetical protein